MSLPVTIELYGTLRLKTGQAVVPLLASSVQEALSSLRGRFPALGEAISPEGHLHAAYRICLNGHHFPTDPATPLQTGDCLLLIAADAGG